MSQISQKSISGITSITTPAGVDNQFTIHTNNRSEALKLDHAGNLHFHNHVNTTGISSASNFKTGTSNLHNTGLNVQDLDVDGHTNLDNVSIAGITTFTNGAGVADFKPIQLEKSATTGATRIQFLENGTNKGGITYSHDNNRIEIQAESSGKIRFNDVSNAQFALLDGTGLTVNGASGITALAADINGDLDVDGHTNLDNVSIAGVTTMGQIKVGTGVTIETNGQATFTGIVTASTYYGDGSNLSNITSTNIVNNASGRLVVGSNTANTLDAKSEATYNGTKLLLTGGVGQDQHIPMLELKHLNTAYSSGNGDGPAILLNGYYASNEWALAKIAAVNAGGQYGSGYGGGLQFWVHPANGTQTASVIKGAEIIGDGTGADLYITDGDIKFASGHGIDFGATANGGTGTPNELFDDYEEGSWTPAIEGLSNTPSFHNLGGTYTKIGNRVWIQCHIQINGSNKPQFSNQSASFKISGLPFTGQGTNGTGYFGAHGVCVWQQLQWVGGSYSSYGHGDDTQLSPGIVDGGTRISLQTCGQGIYYTGQLLNRAIHNNYAPNIEFDMSYRTAT